MIIKMLELIIDDFEDQKNCGEYNRFPPKYKLKGYKSQAGYAEILVPRCKDIRKLKTLNIRHLGELIAGGKFWRELGMDEVLNRFIPATHLSGNVPLLIKTIILFKLVEPVSKLKLSENYQRLTLSELEGKSFEPQHFYRAMDELIPHKKNIEIT